MGGSRACSAYGFSVSSSDGADAVNALIYPMNGVNIDSLGLLTVDSGGSGGGAWTKRPVAISTV